MRKFTVSIYILKHPKTNDVYYVGASTDVALRYKTHSIANTAVGRWFKDLAKNKLQPIMVELKQIQVRSEYAYRAIHDDKVRESECSFIMKHVKDGHPLLNTRGVKHPSHNPNIILLNNKAA